jgi:hypothetical protein
MTSWLLPLAGAVAGMAYKASADDALRTALQGLDPPPYYLQPRYKMSLIVPALNEYRYIGNLLRSAHNQVEAFSEIIVADCSDPGEGTPELARSWGARVITVPRGNISASRNLGAAAAQGPDVLVFADADMVLGQHFTERALDALEAGAVLVHPRMALYDSAGWHLAMHLPELLRQANYCGGCIMVRAQEFQELGGYNEACNMIQDGRCFEVREIADRVIDRYGWSSVAVLPVLIGASARRFQKFGLLGGGGRNFATPVRAVQYVTRRA